MEFKGQKTEDIKPQKRMAPSEALDIERILDYER